MRTLAIGLIGATLTLALAAPAWARGPTTKAPSLTVAGKDSCASHRHTYKTHRNRGGGGGTSADNSANMLNAQELSRLQGGAMAPAPMVSPGGNR